jgi:hypothetical protein
MKDKIKNPVDNLYKRAEREVPEYKELDMNKFTKEIAQELANKFADESIPLDDVYVKFGTNSSNFLGQVAIRKDTLNPELSRITVGIHRKSDRIGYKRTDSAMPKEELIRYLTSEQGIEIIKKDLAELLEKAIYMD